jgi:hypothetical protein
MAQRPWLAVLAIYLLLFGSLLLWTRGYPYALDNNESYSSLWHARSLFENGVAQTKGLTDEVFAHHPEASPYIHSHQGNFPRLFTFVLYSLGLRTIGPQIWVTTFTVGLAALWLAFHFLSRIGNPLYAALTCGLLMTDYLFFTQWQVGLYNIWHGFFFFSSLVCVQSLGETGSRGRWFVLAFVNFAALFYWEYVFTAFVTVLCGVYAVGLYWRRFRLVLLLAAAMGAGAAMAAGVLLAQLTAYMGWANVMEDVRLTLTARNAAADPALLERVTSFYREHRIIFWHNFTEAAPLRSPGALWGSLLQYHLRYYSPALLYAALVLAAGWGLGCWHWSHRHWRRVLPLLLLGGLVAWAWPAVAGIQDAELRDQLALTPGGTVLMGLEGVLLVLATALALVCAGAGNPVVFGHRTGRVAGILPVLLCGAVAYAVTYRVFTGYVYSGYLHRFVPLTVFLTAPVLGLTLYLLWQGAQRAILLVRPVAASGRPYRLLTATLAAAAVGAVALFTAHWAAWQFTYARIAPPDAYSFLRRLEQPPYRGHSLVTNAYPAPLVARMGTWGYADASFSSGSLTLGPDGFKVERDLKYLWFADRDTNPAYLKPDFAITVIHPPNFGEALERHEEWLYPDPAHPPRVENSGLIRRARSLPQPFLKHRLVESDGRRFSAVQLDWDYPPFLQVLEDERRHIAAHYSFAEKMALSESGQELRRRWRIEVEPVEGTGPVRLVRADCDAEPVFPGASVTAPLAHGRQVQIVHGDQVELTFARGAGAGTVRVAINDHTEVIDLAQGGPAPLTFGVSSNQPHGRFTSLPSFPPGSHVRVRPADSGLVEVSYHYVHQEQSPETGTVLRIYLESATDRWRLADEITLLGPAGLPVRLEQFRRANPDTVAEFARSQARNDPRTYEQWLADHLAAHPEEWRRVGFLREALTSAPAAGGATVTRRVPLDPALAGRMRISVAPGTRTKRGPEYFSIPFDVTAAGMTAAALVPAGATADQKLLYGRLKVRLRFPQHPLHGVEPLLATGLNEAGDFVYVIYQGPDHIRLGFDHWFRGGPITPPIPVDRTVEHELEISLGSLYPPAEDVIFYGTAPETVAALKRHVLVRLDGQTVLETAADTYESPPRQVTVGRNTIKGTSSGPEFSGEIVAVERQWFE